MWFEAARMGDLDTLHVCLFWGQRVDQLSGDGRTALSMAAEGGHAAAVALLLERRSNPNLHAAGGLRPLTAAINNEHWDIANDLLRAGADPNPDGVASIVIAQPPKYRLLALMFQRGLDPHGSHPEYGPYIHFALSDAVCADMFVGAGFDVRRYERETGESLLERALSAGGTGRLLHVLSLGADVNLPVDRATGRSMLIAAAEEPGPQAEGLIRMLVKRGGDLDQRDAAGLTALDHARARRNDAAVKALNRLRAERARAAKAEAKAARQREAAERKAAARPAGATKTPRRRRADSKRQRHDPQDPPASVKHVPEAPPAPGAVPGRTSEVPLAGESAADAEPPAAADEPRESPVHAR